jgi:hypothetical protein
MLHLLRELFSDFLSPSTLFHCDYGAHTQVVQAVCLQWKIKCIYRGMRTSYPHSKCIVKHAKSKLFCFCWFWKRPLHVQGSILTIDNMTVCLFYHPFIINNILLLFCIWPDCFVILWPDLCFRWFMDDVYHAAVPFLWEFWSWSLRQAVSHVTV